MLIFLWRDEGRERLFVCSLACQAFGEQFSSLGLKSWRNVLQELAHYVVGSFRYRIVSLHCVQPVDQLLDVGSDLSIVVLGVPALISKLKE